MPIDDALETIKGVPEHVLKEPLEIITKFPQTVEELQERYKDKFEITLKISNTNTRWINIIDANKYSDSNNKFLLCYTIGIDKPLEDLDKKGRTVIIRESRHYALKGAYYNYYDGFWRYIHEGCMYTNDEINKLNTDKIKDLKKWFSKNEDFFLKEIPELNEFVKNYNAN
jgi:hypothetical protein